MKSIASAIFFIALSAFAVEMHTNVLTGAVAPQPSRRPVDAVGAPAGWFDDPGWKKFDLQQQADWDAAEAAKAEAEAAAAAQYADVQPVIFVPRFKGALTNVVGLSQEFVDDETGEAVFVDETGSPEHTQSQKEAQHAARKAQRAAAGQAVENASKNGKVNDRLDAIEAWIRSHR